MTSNPVSATDDLAAVRSILGPIDPVPDPTLDGQEVLAARASVGLTRTAAAPARPRSGRLVVAGAVAVLSVVTLVALVAMPASRDTDTFALATGPGGQAVNTAYAATADAGTARGMLTVTDGTSTVTATGVGSFDGGTARAEVVLAEAAGIAATSITVVRTGEAIFVRLPDGANPLAAGKPWVSVDAATLTQLAQMALGELGAQVAGAPSDALAYLRGVSGDVQVVGPDTVRGEPTTHYRGTVDSSKVLAQLPATSRAEAARAGGPSAIPAELWIDASGRLRKLVLAVEVPELGGRTASTSPTPSGASSTSAAVTLELWDFGTPVDATAPPADQVVDVGGMLGGFLGGARRP